MVCCFAVRQVTSEDDALAEIKQKQEEVVSSLIQEQVRSCIVNFFISLFTLHSIDIIPLCTKKYIRAYCNY